MSTFEDAVAVCLEHEGGYVDSVDDKGGATNFGITQADMPGQNMQMLTQAQAENYYSEHYWKSGYGEIALQDVCNKVFDMGVLFGIGTAIRLLQTVLGVQIDENLGPGTLAALNDRGEAFLAPYKARLVIHAQWIVQTDPSQLGFLNGWLNRINS